MTFKQALRKPFRYAYWNAALIIIGLNFIVYMLCRLMPQLYSYLSLNVHNLVNFHMYWQFVTYMFVHDMSSIWHLVFNMLALLIFGMSVERSLGSKEFVLFYMVTGTLCGVVSFLIYYFSGAYNVFLMGASGAIYAVLLSYAVLFPRSTIFIWGIIPIPAPVLVGLYAVIEIVSQLVNIRSGVAHMTHLAGLVIAWLYFLVRMGVSPWKVWKQNFR